MAPTATPRMPITLCVVVQIIPQELGEHAYLEEDLTRIGSIGLISTSWTVKDKKIVRKILTGVSNQYHMIVCNKSETWSTEKWREAYRFNARDEGFASKIEKFISGKFQNPVNPKDGFVVVDCKDVRAKRCWNSSFQSYI